MVWGLTGRPHFPAGCRAPCLAEPKGQEGHIRDSHGTALGPRQVLRSCWPQVRRASEARRGCANRCAGNGRVTDMAHGQLARAMGWGLTRGALGRVLHSPGGHVRGPGPALRVALGTGPFLRAELPAEEMSAFACSPAPE